MRISIMLTVAMLGLAIATRPAQGQNEQKLADKDFIAKAGSTGQLQVKASELAVQKSTNTDLRSYAQQMIKDHTKANQELTTLLTRQGQAAPVAMDPSDTETLDRLSKLQSYDFDKAYGEVQLRTHERAVALFQQASKECEDPDLKAWAAKTLPTLREHLQMAQRIFRKIGDK
jgi:putative membrane protein